MEIRRIAGTSFRVGDRPGKETMRKEIKKKLIVVCFIVLSLTGLFGCTKREQLTIMTKEQDTQAEQETQKIQDAGEELSVTDMQAGRYEGMPENTSEDMSASAEQPQGPAPAPQTEQTIFVHVCGAVRTPGVYELKSGSRVYEAVEAAGGFTDDAEESYVNQAQILSDGTKLMIPTVEEALAMPQGGMEALTENDAASESAEKDLTGQSADDGRVNINTASQQELCTIPGIGATRAAAIVQYRQEHGSFGSAEDIMKVTGIKEGTYEKIKDSIKVN